MQIPAALTLLLALTACAAPALAPPVAPDRDGRAERIALECRLLERASAAMAARGQTPPPDIEVGCPGREGLRDAMTMAEMSAATRRANAARPPAVVQGMGPRADMVYRRMITRGVPVAVAEELAATPEFAAAVQ